MRSGSPVPLLLALMVLLGCLTTVAGVAGATGLPAVHDPATTPPAAATTPPAAAHGSVVAASATGTVQVLADATATAGLSPPRGRAQLADEPAVDGTTIIIRVQDDGDAHVSVIYAYRLDGQNESQAFDERIAPRFENGEFDSFDDDQFREVVERSDNVNARSMTLESVSRNAFSHRRLQPDTTTGYLAMNFTWTNFAVQRGNAIRVGSAFNASVANSSETGTWLPYLRDDQSLIIVPPPGYRVDSAIGTDGVRPGAIIRWDGPRSFTPGQIEIAYERSPTTAGPGPTPSPEPGIPWIPILAAGIVLLTLIALGAYTFSRDDGVPGATGAASANGGLDDDGSGSTAADAGDAASAATAASASASAAASADGAETAAPHDAAVDPDLLSDEERVERLLERNGGRMKQANIVRETGWSNAKVSQLLTSMDEADRVDKLRIGRENLISLPDEDDY